MQQHIWSLTVALLTNPEAPKRGAPVGAGAVMVRVKTAVLCDLKRGFSVLGRQRHPVLSSPSSTQYRRIGMQSENQKRASSAWAVRQKEKWAKIRTSFLNNLLLTQPCADCRKRAPLGDEAGVEVSFVYTTGRGDIAIGDLANLNMDKLVKELRKCEILCVDCEKGCGGTNRKK